MEPLSRHVPLWPRNPVRGFLSSVGLDPEIQVFFQYNPDRLQDRRSVNYATVEAPGMLLPDRHYSHGGDRAIRFTVHVDGVFPGPADDAVQTRIARDEDGSIAPELNKYRAFLYPANGLWQQARASFLPIYEEVRHFASPPLCRFGFGARVIDCVVTEVGITETLFTPGLAPLRAEVEVSLVEIRPYAAQEGGF